MDDFRLDLLPVEPPTEVRREPVFPPKKVAREGKDDEREYFLGVFGGLALCFKLSLIFFSFILRTAALLLMLALWLGGSIDSNLSFLAAEAEAPAPILSMTGYILRQLSSKMHLVILVEH